MSFHRFIASNSRVQACDNTGAEVISHQEAVKRGYTFNPDWVDMSQQATVMVFDDEEAMGNLQVINREADSFEHAYTCKKCIAEVAMRYSDHTLTDLYNYIRKSLETLEELEFWVLLLDQDKDVTHIRVNVAEFSEDNLKSFYEYDHGHYPRCLTICT